MFLHKKTLGLEIMQDGVRMALLGGSAKSPRLDAFGMAAFPHETIRSALKEPNVLNPSAFVSKVKETYLLLVTEVSRVSVSLPDSAGRVILLDLETRFKSREEGADIIRWKLKKNFPYDIQDAHIDFQQLQTKPTGEISLLVSLVAKQVVNQYEELLVEAGLQPNRIDFSLFNLYRLFGDRFNVSDNYAFLVCREGMIGMMFFSNGILTFYRSKELPGGKFDGNRLFREISSSLLVHKEKQEDTPLTEVFCITPPDHRETLRGIVTEAAGLEPIVLQPDEQVASGAGSGADTATLHLLASAIGAGLRNF